MPKRAHIHKAHTVLVPTRDYEHVTKRGWLTASDYRLFAGRVVYEVNPATLEAIPIGLVKKPEFMGEVVKRAGTAKAKRNQLVRVNDLMDLKRLCWRTGRSKATIVGTWMKWKDWPAPVARFGRSDVWLWSEVHEAMERHGLTVRKESA